MINYLLSAPTIRELNTSNSATIYFKSPSSTVMLAPGTNNQNVLLKNIHHFDHVEHPKMICPLHRNECNLNLLASGTIVTFEYTNKVVVNLDEAFYVPEQV